MSRQPGTDPLDLQELVENPPEKMSVELKRWLDTDDPIAKAKLARHMCALANFGGGHLVFGFNDDRTSAGACPFPLAKYSRDVLASIIDRYLVPVFEVEQNVVRASSSVDHIVVWVPPCGRLPVSAKASGPNGQGNKPQGIVQGHHYTRMPGPKSVPVNTPELWAPIIRRCLLQDRLALLGDLAALLGPATEMPFAIVTKPQAEGQEDTLAKWHKAARRKFLETYSTDALQAARCKAHYEFSYHIRTEPPDLLNPGKILDILEQANGELRDTVYTGWSMMHVFSRPELAPYFATDPSSSEGERDIVECDLGGEPHQTSSLPDFWRASLSGKVSLIRAYREDRQDWPPEYAPGTWLFPVYLGREIAEFVRHARALAGHFPHARSVEFRMEWWGLQGREIKAPGGVYFNKGHIARTDTRLAVEQVPIPDLGPDRWPDLVSRVVSSVLRAFQPPLDASPETIRVWSEWFRPLDRPQGGIYDRP